MVVGYDGSDAARAAVDHAADRAGADGALIVVHAYGPPPDWLGLPDFSRVLEDHRRRGEAILDGLLLGGSDELADMDYETELADGSPTEALIRVADDRGADEIVVGSRGHGTLRSALGSVAHGVIGGARCPVTVLPQAYLEARRAGYQQAGSEGRAV